MTRTCDAIQCTANVASGRFMCLSHWRMVPLDLQRTINARYRACREGYGFLSDPAYLSAAVDSIDKIALAEGYLQAGQISAANPYRRHLAGAQRRAQPGPPIPLTTYVYCGECPNISTGCVDRCVKA